ncbi:hypothetical protein EW146_g7002 [Bondarzewia mesenterica]|uniref:PLP-dependent transferase n=1 Tax=Bondarzewia mesenterica TaxID=1095465 RepID=A0A4S4LMR1_9AGAM|nr:hypothetical protein EW146_g7002 [Bondarzewia mesenterica]
MSSQQSAVGQPVPPTKHAVSVSLPTWADTVGYKMGDAGILKCMQNGYPRYFIHMSIRKLAYICEQRYATASERSLLLGSYDAAEACLLFMATRNVSVRGVMRLRLPDARPGAQVYVVFFPAESFHIAKQFWQYTGHGISSRLADHCLVSIEIESSHSELVLERVTDSMADNSATHELALEAISNCAATAKMAIRLRIAHLLAYDVSADAAEDEAALPQRTGMPVTENDVFLYGAGMTAIWSAHQLCIRSLGARKSVCFGFPYADTLKVLQKWGPGCHFFPDGEESSIESLEALLSTQQALDLTHPPILALFTEFPSNPLLRSVDLLRLRTLADKYSFPIVVDDTIGNSVNVRVMPYADIVVTSLTKVTSGHANVMGGSLVLNPSSKHYAALRASLQQTYQDVYFDEDAILMERNSRDFLHRVNIINDNAEAVCNVLRSASPVIKEVFYPKWQTYANYDACRVKSSSGKGGGYGGLFSLLFASFPAAREFYDALPFAKGPSLGTNFTLACPYAILAHFEELEWAAQYGVPDGLVRVSVGLEEKGVLLEGILIAVKAAERAHAKMMKDDGDYGKAQGLKL